MDARGSQPGGCADSGAQDHAVVGCSEAVELAIDVENALASEAHHSHGELPGPARRARPMAAERMLLTEIQHVKSSEELFRNIISFNFPSPVAQRAFETSNCRSGWLCRTTQPPSK